jgi:elongin-A
MVAIVSLGNTPYPLCEPVLRSCSAEQLLALEKNSPVSTRVASFRAEGAHVHLGQHLEDEDQEVWQSLCFRDFPRSEAQYEKEEFPEPESWREQYFVRGTISHLSQLFYTPLFSP